MRRLLLSLFFIYLIKWAVAEDCDDVELSHESRLQKKLLCKYDRSNRPVKDHNTAVTIRVGMRVKTLQFSHQMESSESISVVSWLHMTWKDEFLTWNPSDYGNLDEILMLSSKIWVPDLTVHNTQGYVGTYFNSPCIVEKDGKVSCIPQVRHTALCNMNYANWPKDVQNCTIRFGTWMHKGEHVNLELSTKVPISMNQYTENKYWKILKSAAWRNPGVFASLDETYPTLSFSFMVERHMAALSIRLWTPILSMMLMTAVSLCLNIISLERVILMLFNVGCHFFFISSSEYYMPSTGTVVPNLLAYYRDTTIIACALLFETVLLKNLVRYTTSSPNWVIALTGLMNTSAGKIVFHEFDPVADVNKADDVESLTPENIKIASNAEWRKFAMFVNRLFSLIVILAYIIIFLRSLG